MTALHPDVSNERPSTRTERALAIALLKRIVAEPSGA